MVLAEFALYFTEMPVRINSTKEINMGTSEIAHMYTTAFHILLNEYVSLLFVRTLDDGENLFTYKRINGAIDVCRERVLKNFTI